MARSFIPNTAWARRLIYELIYLSFGFNRTGMFNVGFAPARPDIRANPAFADRPNQIQLYAEMFNRIPWEAERWRRSDCLELAAGCGGGLLYLNTHHAPRRSIGVEQSNVAAWRARRLGVDVRQGDVARLAFDDGRFDGVFCVDALGYFPVAAALKEAFRVMRPGGYFLLAETFHGSRDAARDHFRRIGEAAGFDFLGCHEATDGVRRSLLEGSKSPAFVLTLPAPLRDRLRETLFLEGSERLRLWQTGAFSFVIVTFGRPPLRTQPCGCPA
jgi:SAM-dependent methyltransferase